MIFWREAMSIGSTGLDNDHRRLIGLVNQAEEGLAHADAALLASVLEDLVTYVNLHFHREEAVLEAIGYPARHLHCSHHAALARTVHVLHDRFRATAGGMEQHRHAGQLARLLHDWLIEHILKEDMHLKPYLLQRKAAPAVAGHRNAAAGGPGRPHDDRPHDIAYELPPELAHLLARLDYTVPQLPPPQGGFASFDELCRAAIARRIDSVLVFFQRHNPRVTRELPPPFLLSPEFAERFHQACDRLIVPTILHSRQVQVLAAGFEWAAADTDSFWQQGGRQLPAQVLKSWTAAWNQLRLVEIHKPDGTRVLQVKDGVRTLRDMLAPPSPAAYDLPRVGNREIDVFVSLLDPVTEWWERLNAVWRGCHELYEQEKDPRVYQMQARDGALRDNLLAMFGRFPDQWADFLVLACHRVFPRVSSHFLENFVTSLGRTEEQRAERLPYTIRYLRLVRQNPAIRQREMREERAQQVQMQRLRDHLAGRPPAAPERVPAQPGPGATDVS